MNFVWKIFAHVGVNAIGLYLASRYIANFVISPLNFKEVLIAAIGLTLINFFIKPILKLALSPIILLTLGVALIAINGLTLYILDYLLPTVTIGDIQALVYATLLTTGINIIARLIL